MNKKILSIFALIMAISIFGVSCAKDNNTTAPTTTTPIISATEAEAVVNAITDGIGSTAFAFSTATVSGANDKYTVSLKDATTSSEVDSDAFLTAIKGKIVAMQTASKDKITIAESDIKIAVDQENNKKATVTITYKSKDGKKSGTITMNLELTNAGSPSFANPKLVLTLKGEGSAVGTPITLDASVNTQSELTFSVNENDDGVTYTIASVAGLDTSDASGMSANKDLSSGVQNIDTTNITLDSATKTITFNTTVMGSLKTALTFNSAQQIGGIKVTLKASKEGYKDQTTGLEIFIKAVGAES